MIVTLESSLPTTIDELNKLRAPEPLGSMVRLPFMLVELMVLPSKVMLSTKSSLIFLSEPTINAESAVSVPLA